jgi:hypothetical protein
MLVVGQNPEADEVFPGSREEQFLTVAVTCLYFSLTLDLCCFFFFLFSYIVFSCQRRREEEDGPKNARKEWRRGEYLYIVGLTIHRTLQAKPEYICTYSRRRFD